MTPAQIAKIMALVDKLIVTCMEGYRGGFEDTHKARAAVEAALRDAPQQADTTRCIEARNKLNAALHGEGAVIDSLEEAVASACHRLTSTPQQAIPSGTRVVDRGFRFDGEKQQHIPQLVIEFDPAPVNSEYGAKGWKDRDYVAAMLTACDCPAKDMPFSRCCKATPSAPKAVEPPNTDKLADRALAKSFRENPREASLADQAGMRRAIADPLTNRAFNMDGCAPTAVEPDERAEFEAWSDRGFVKAGHAKHHRYNDGYCTAELQSQWTGWQARASKGTP